MHIVPIEEYLRSAETIGVLEGLLLEAHRGRCIGIVFAAMYQGREYIVDIAGEPRKYQTFTLGMVHRLEHELTVLFSGKPPYR